MGQRRKFEVFILDKPYTVLSDGGEEITKLAEFVDKRIREAIDMGHAQNPEKAAVLAALNIAEALFRSRKDLETLEQDIERRSGALLKSLPES